jgi:hypothetical protein
VINVNVTMKFIGYIADGEMWRLLEDISGIGKTGTVLWRREKTRWFILDFNEAKFVALRPFRFTAPEELEEIRKQECHT